MSAPPSDPASSFRPFWPVALPVVVGLAYACGHLGWYLGTPLGRVPVLDERENLNLAEAIFRGALPAEPFYRANGYALLLAGLRSLGLTAAGLFSAALALGAVLHAINAGLVALVARRWFGPVAALIAGLLAALNPVLVHYATQALDAVPSLTLFLAGLVCLAPMLGRQTATSPGQAGRWMGASVCWAAATLMRPNYLLVWLLLPLLAWRTGRARARAADIREHVTYWVTFRPVVAALTGVLLFLAMSGWQQQVSGTAGFLPWQGAYNLWAANQPGTNGRYYTQQVSLPRELAEKNPTRAESVLLYQQETTRNTADIAAMNAHWHARFIGYVVRHPFAWLGLLARKSYALLNDWEQYNNKTYAFHQDLSPWLRWNPLSFGILFLLGLAGAVRLAALSPRTAAALALITVTIAASVLLFFVSARFRLPLVAIATVLAGGALAAPGFWQEWPVVKRQALVLLLILAGFVTFSSFDDVRSTATFVQDHALLARAAATVGDDRLAWTEAQAALALQPEHPDAVRSAVASYFNQLLDGTAPLSVEAEWRADCVALLNDPRTDAPDLRAVAAIAFWQAGSHEHALTVWRELGSTPSALAARLLMQDPTAHRAELAALPAAAWTQPLVRLAAVQLALSPPAGIVLEAPEHVAAQVKRIFSRPPTP
jgi:hypothetical protein